MVGNDVIMGKIIDITGRQFGRLTVIAYSHTNHRRTYWLCRCVCGIDKIVLKTNLISGTVGSCGCLHSEVMKNIHINDNQSEIGEIYNNCEILSFQSNNNGKLAKIMAKVKCHCGNSFETSLQALKIGHIKSCGCINKFNEGIAAFNHKYLIYKFSAKYKNKEFSLSKEDCYNLFVDNCFYCSSAPANVVSVKNCNGNFIYNGIDKLIPELGYVITNVVSSCIICNKFKYKLSVYDFINKLKRMKNKNFFGFERISDIGFDLISQESNYKAHRRITKDYSLTQQQYYHLATSNCFYCDGKPSNFNVHSKAKYQGIDQIVPQAGYMYDNCVPCCISCNFAKSNMSQKDFINHIMLLKVNIDNICQALEKLI